MSSIEDTPGRADEQSRDFKMIYGALMHPQSMPCSPGSVNHSNLIATSTMLNTKHESSAQPNSPHLSCCGAVGHDFENIALAIYGNYIRF